MFFVFSSPAAIADHLSQHLVELIRNKPDCRLGLATGSTMEPVYARLLQRMQKDAPDLSRLTTFNLDEYIGLPASHPQSYNYYMHHHLFDRLGLDNSQIHLPDGMSSDPDHECRNYSAAIASAGGLDFQLLGVGTNGHIGFNEPDTPFDSLTHVIELSENTRLDNSRFFDNTDEMPTHAITMGIKDILDAREIVLVATGEHKADVMNLLYRTPADPKMPASALKLHPNVRIYLDAAAASRLPAEALHHVD